jgi:hypothetical protein
MCRQREVFQFDEQLEHNMQHVYGESLKIVYKFCKKIDGLVW